MTHPAASDGPGWRLPVQTDVALAIASLVLADAVIVGATAGTPLRAAFGLLLFFFLPGYALVSALYPEQRQTDSPSSRFAPSATERAVLALGSSVALAPLFGIGLWYTVGIGPVALAGALSAFVLAGFLVAVVRRSRRPPSQRFDIRPRHRLGRVLDGDAPIDFSVNVALVVVLLVSLSTLGFALVAPADTDGFTNVMLLTENESGEYVSGDYPASVTAGQPQEFVLGIDNRERESVDYTAVVQLQRVDPDGDAATVRDRMELRRLSATIAPNRTRYIEHRIRPNETGRNLRLTYLVYRGDVPDEPTAENAYRWTHVWLNVTD